MPEICMSAHDWELIEEKLRVRDTALEHFQIMQKTLHALESEALEKAAADISRRLDESNKFREQINKERSDYLQREIYEREHASLEDRVKVLEIARGENKGEDTGKAATYATLMGIAVVIVQIVLHYLK